MLEAMFDDGFIYPIEVICEIRVAQTSGRPGISNFEGPDVTSLSGATRTGSPVMFSPSAVKPPVVSGSLVMSSRFSSNPNGNTEV